MSTRRDLVSQLPSPVNSGYLRSGVSESKIKAAKQEAIHDSEGSSCSVCAYEPRGQFKNRRANLHRHVYEKHASFDCPFCSRIFSGKVNLILHISKIHKETESEAKEDKVSQAVDNGSRSDSLSRDRQEIHSYLTAEFSVTRPDSPISRWSRTYPEPLMTYPDPFIRTSSTMSPTHPGRLVQEGLRHDDLQHWDNSENMTWRSGGSLEYLTATSDEPADIFDRSVLWSVPMPIDAVEQLGDVDGPDPSTLLPSEQPLLDTVSSQEYSSNNIAQTSDTFDVPKEHKDTIEKYDAATQKDSGYHSGDASDTASDISVFSTTSSLGLRSDVLEEFISLFGDVLIDKSSARTWANLSGSERSVQMIERPLRTALKQYAIQQALHHSNHGKALASEIHRAARLVRHFRPKLARYVREKSGRSEQELSSMEDRLRSLGKQLTLAEKLALSNKHGSEARPVLSDSEDDSDSEDEEERFTDLTCVLDSLTSSEAFENLVTEVRRILYHDDTLNMKHIAQLVIDVLSIPWSDRRTIHAQIRRIELQISWDLGRFLSKQFGHEKVDIGSVVVLTGASMHAQATTCSGYMSTTWPQSGSDTIPLLQAIADLTTDSWRSSCTRRLSHGLEVSVEFDLTAKDSRSLVVTAHGTEKQLIELTQQLTWFGSVMSLSPREERLAYCKPQLNDFRKGLSMLKFSFVSSSLQASETACWLPLFCGASIAKGFPVPRRNNAFGLEVPLQIAGALIGARGMVEFEDTLVIKGFSSMLVPVSQTGDIVQWHLVTNEDHETRLSYQEGLKRCPGRATLSQVNAEYARTMRAVIGWCTHISSRLGCSSVDYSKLSYSRAEEVGRRVALTGGTLGFQQFGMAQLDFTLGPKDGKQHFHRSGPYRSIVNAADKSPVLMYDPEEKRAWLVPASHVMLHIAHTRNHTSPFDIAGAQVKLPYHDEYSSARDALLRDASLKLIEEENYTFRDMILGIWDHLEVLIDQNVSTSQAPGYTVNPKRHDTIQGFEFMGLVEERSPLERKEVSIDKTCGGWPVFVQDMRAPVLLANGLGDVLQPTEESLKHGLCHSWLRMPKDKDYLATTVRTLQDRYNVSGCQEDHTYLSSSHLQWHRGESKLFEACLELGEATCSCVRLQQIVPELVLGNVVPPGELQDEGAVIFGHSSSAGNSVKTFLGKRKRRMTPVQLTRNVFRHLQSSTQRSNVSCSVEASQPPRAPVETTDAKISTFESEPLQGNALVKVNSIGPRGSLASSATHESSSSCNEPKAGSPQSKHHFWKDWNWRASRQHT